MTDAYFDKHRETLDTALKAIRTRDYWSPYPERASGSIYGETANDDGRAAFESWLGKPFEIAGQPAEGMRTGEERSPYGFDLGVSYPNSTVDRLIPAARSALKAWRDAGPEARTGVCIEILDRINKRSFDYAYAVMHTTGQGFMMAFQAAGPHAQDRGLEAVAYAYEAMSSVPAHARWEKPQGKNPPLVMDKYFKVVPRGVAALVGCATFPTWNGFPGLMASLVTGNPVIVKPHPKTVLPLALTVRIARETLAEAGFNPNLVTLLVDGVADPVAQDLCTRPEVKIVDFTGGSAFGSWLERNATQAQVYAEKSGVNAIVIDDFADVKGMSRNLAFSLSLYSGQMCTTPQNIFIPRDGIRTGDGRMSFDEVAEALATGVSKFLADPERASAVLGGIQSDATLERLEKAKALGAVVLESQPVKHPEFENATVRTPMMVKLDGAAIETYSMEMFGPISFLIATDGTADSLVKLRTTVAEHGAITAGVYSDSEETLAAAREVCEEVGVALSCNLTGGVFVNQTAAFSDFHATGANPAANAALVDQAFVANRFRVVETRVPA